MIKNKLTSCLVLMSAVFAIGCSSSGGSGAPADGGGGVGSSAFNGTWLRPCAIDDVNINLSDGVYEVTTLVFNGSSVIGTILSFDDADCTIPTAPHELVITSTAAFPGGVEATELGDAQFIDITTTNVTLDGVPPPVAGLFPFTTYDIILLSGSTLYTGFFEEEDSGESPATRPTMLDTEYAFTRQ